MQNRQEPKRMLEIQKREDKWIVHMNSSSLDLIQTCLRKAHYSLNRQLRSPGDESAALAFGSAIHKGLEHWYSLPATKRQLSSAEREAAQLMAFGHHLDDDCDGALESVRQFVRARYDVLKALENDKRSLENGVKILMEYFKKYYDDPLEVARDEAGPMVERNVSFLMHEEPGLEIHYFGTIDVILRNTETGVLLVTDHKTTSALGQEFYNRCKPNFQYTGYVLAAKSALGLDTNLFMINGIQVAKTKASFARQITERTEEDFDELRVAVRHNVMRWLEATSTESFPMAPPNPCASYGGCQYLRICEVPHKLKENVIRSLFSEGTDADNSLRKYESNGSPGSCHV